MSTTSIFVSCLLPTYNRRTFVPRAIEYFLRQDYPHKELLILDNGSDPVADLVPVDERIRYVRLEKRLSLGAKRNLAVEQARGNLLMHWDDDDWYAPRRIRYQVEALQAAGAEVCGLRQMLFHDIVTGRTWLYTYPPGARPWLAGGSLLYTRDFWKRFPFPEVKAGEDTRFVWGHSLENALFLSDHTFYVAMIHPGNTSPKRVRGSYWRAWGGDLDAIMGADLDKMRRPEEGEGRPASRGKTPATVAEPEAGLTESSGRERRPRVTVSIPCFNASQTISRAVRSILAQTYPDLTLVVVNDRGEPPWGLLENIDDPRLVRFDLQANHGRYFADAVVLAATDSPYFLIQDADDWSDSQRLAALLQSLRASHACGALSAHWRHGDQRSGSRGMIEPCANLDRPLAAHLEHRAYHTGLFRADALRAVGGYYGGFRIGYDTLLINLLMMIGRLACVNRPLYHRLIHKGSLTTDPATGLCSSVRREVAQLLRQMYVDAFQTYRHYVEGRMELDELCAEIRKITARHVLPEERSTLQAEAMRLRKMLENNDGSLVFRAGIQENTPGEAHPSARPVLVASAAPPGGPPLDLPARTNYPSAGESLLAISILTGGRLEYLRRTIRSLQQTAPDLLEMATIVVFINGRDPHTYAYVNELPFVKKVLYHRQGTLPTGDAMSRLVKTLSKISQSPLLLHLDGEWETSLSAKEWFGQASAILAAYPVVGQVRLRHSQEKVLPYHMITRQPIQWQACDGFLLAKSAHFTFHPSLVRMTDAARIYPCRSEHEAQRRFLSTGLASAQLLPGVFRHIGEETNGRRVARGGEGFLSRPAGRTSAR
jgi:glycosyltransferase involved in cell wall biosynthesis